ncbi:unnamed protein product [Adineta steineri]|uniref:LamG-like jellyroll fold domain-containing protein n=2 Tax=Adineta steineri TaxID=433720 RepID=A0A819MDR9_9BILA|nr:unnamed protein product [Adineta steineri]
MDNNAVDIISGLNGKGINSPTYVTPGITGSGYALKLIRSSHQYVTIPTYKSFVNTSFTVEMWIYPIILNSGELFGLFNQYDTSAGDHSLQMMIRGLQMTFDFYADGVTGTTSLTTYTWYHAAFVYDYPSKTQTVYLNGYQDASRISNQPYLGMAGPINIGMYQNGCSYIFSYIDQVSLTMAAKSADDILNDATLASWHSFDSGITYDSGPNKLQGKPVGVTLAPGKVNQGLNFSLSASYYQIPGYVLIGVKSSSFSMSLWVQRTSTGGGTLVHYSVQTNGKGWCIVPIGFSSAGNIIATVWAPQNQVTGPILSVNTWTHIATTYSQTYGLTLYVNGVFVGSTAPQSNDAPDTAIILILGNSLGGGGCNSQSIVTGIFSGYLDEFRVYSRELSAIEVSALAKDKTCFDGLMNGDETDIDCGGSCLTCAVGKNCTLTKDCDNLQCTNDICASAACNDTIKNNEETDVDCGGLNCSSCGTGKACSGAGDCVSKSCAFDICKDKTCSDGIMNGDETDIDCGGSCPVCGVYKMCKVDLDCITGCSNIACINGYCEPFPNEAYSFWRMENNAVDIISGLNGTDFNSPTYITPGITGGGYALKLIRSSYQYITIPTYKSFVNTSFTVEMWIYPTSLNNGYYYGLFTQYDTTSTDHSLVMLVRGVQLSLDFYNDGVTGTTSLTTYTWYHAAFVYDYPSKTQTVYLNGYQDASHVSNQPYLGTSGSINIGIYIDQVSLTMAPKSADDILNDATLASWHSFDCETSYDSGPNKLRGMAVDVTLAPGKVDQGLNFSLSSSYYQVRYRLS